MIGRFVVFLILALSSLPFIGAGHDDAWIMLLAGKEVGFGHWFINPNGVPQEVSTSVLGTLLASFVLYVAPDGSEFMWWKVATWLPAVLSGLVLFEILLQRLGRAKSIFWVFVLCCFPEWHYWAWGGIESGLFWFFLLLFSLASARYVERPSEGRAAVLTLMTFAMPLARADALWSPFVAALVFLQNGKESRSRQVARSLVSLFLVVVFHLARYHFTGKFLPNPAYAKASLSLESLRYGADYMWSFHLETPLHFALMLAYPFAVIGSVRLLRRLSQASGQGSDCFEWASLLLLIVDATTVVVGGDWMGFHRFAVRTLPLKIMVIAIWSKGFLSESERRTRLSMIACLVLSLTGLMSSGVVQRPGLFRHGSAIARVQMDDLTTWNHLFVQSNIPTRRDVEVLAPWIDTDLSILVSAKRASGAPPIKFASYQAGYFPWALRRHFAPSDVLFIDLAGLSDHRLGSLPGAKSPLGLEEGIRHWAESISLGQGALGQALVQCRPDLVYVLRASKEQRLMMKQAGFEVVYEKKTVIEHKVFSAVIFQLQQRNDGRCPVLGLT